LLENGEHVIEQFPGTSRYRIWPAALIAFPPAFFLELTGRGNLVPWLMGALMGGYIFMGLRLYYLVLTDRLVHAFALKRGSSTKVEQHDAYPVEEMTASYDQGILNGRLVLQMGDTKLNLQVGQAFKDRAARFVDPIRGDATRGER
jgi:hypothetical protein